MKTAEDFKKQAEEKNITSWYVRSCSICGVPIGFIFRGSQAFFDGSCGCTRVSSLPQPRTWEKVAEFYNMQTNPGVIETMNEFWGFES